MLERTLFYDLAVHLPLQELLFPVSSRAEYLGVSGSNQKHLAWKICRAFRHLSCR